MNAYELLEQLFNKPKEEIEHALLMLMCVGKVDFLAVQSAYVEYLEKLKDLNLRQLVEAETCVIESLQYDRIPKSKLAEISTQRRLYLLNRSRRFRMDSLNEKYHYDEERAKTYNHVNDIEMR